MSLNSAKYRGNPATWIDQIPPDGPSSTYTQTQIVDLLRARSIDEALMSAIQASFNAQAQVSYAEGYLDGKAMADIRVMSQTSDSLPSVNSSRPTHSGEQQAQTKNRISTLEGDFEPPY